MRHCLVLPIFILAACQPAPPDPRGVDREETLLAVSASGRSEARPDEARISLGVSSRAGSGAEAMRLNAEKMNRVASASISRWRPSNQAKAGAFLRR